MALKSDFKCAYLLKENQDTSLASELEIIENNLPDDFKCNIAAGLFEDTFLISTLKGLPTSVQEV